MSDVEERVDRLEVALENFVTSVGIEFNKVYNMIMLMELDTKELKAEMREFCERSEQEARQFKSETHQANRNMNRRWGEISDKMGTMVKDLIWPSLERIVEELVGQEVLQLVIGYRRRRPDGSMQEFDAIAVTVDTVFLNRTKSTLRSSDVDKFTQEIDTFRELFPEYQSYPLVGVLASLAVEASVLSYAERTGFVVLAVGDQLMDIQNQPDFVPKRW